LILTEGAFEQDGCETVFAAPHLLAVQLEV